MKKGNDYTDDFLKKLIQKSALESPSEDFIQKVMADIELHPLVSPEKKPFFLYLKRLLPWGLLVFILVIVLVTSDIPFMNFIPGKESLSNLFIPYYHILIKGMTSLFGTAKIIFLVFSVILSIVFLMGIDFMVNKKKSVFGHLLM